MHVCWDGGGTTAGRRSEEGRGAAFDEQDNVDKNGDVTAFTIPFAIEPGEEEASEVLVICLSQRMGDGQTTAGSVASILSCSLFHKFSNSSSALASLLARPSRSASLADASCCLRCCLDGALFALFRHRLSLSAAAQTPSEGGIGGIGGIGGVGSTSVGRVGGGGPAGIRIGGTAVGPGAVAVPRQTPRVRVAETKWLEEASLFAKSHCRH